MRVARGVVLIGVMATIVVAGEVSRVAATEFRAYGQTFTKFGSFPPIVTPYDVTDDMLAADGVDVEPGGQLQARAASQASATAGLGANAFGYIQQVGPLQENDTRNGSAVAEATYVMTLTGPGGPGFIVQTSFKMLLTGTLAVASVPTAGQANAGSAGIGISYRLDGMLLSATPANGSTGSRNVTTTGGGPVTVTSLDALVGWTEPSGVVTSPTFSVVAGTPFTLQVQLNATAQASALQGESGFIASGSSNFGHTLRFVSNGPVFDLPDGYTVNSPDAGIVDNRAPCTSNCTQPRSGCDAGKLKCIAARQACLLKVHAAAEKKGVTPDAAALQKCADAFDGGAKGEAQGCVGKIEGKQKPAKPKTVCSVTGQLAALEAAGDDFVTDMVTAIDPAFPTVGPASTCDAGKKACALQRTACLLKEQARAGAKGEPADPAKIQKCTDKFDGGAKGFAKGCLGKLEAKQSPAKPATQCSVTGDETTLETRIDAFVTDSVATVLDTE